MGPKSQHGAPTFEPPDTVKIILSIIKSDLDYFMQKHYAGLMLRVESSFLLNPTLNASLKPHLQKVLPCRHPCHN